MVKESIEVNFPFGFCKKCNRMRINMETLYSDNEPVMNYAYCTNQEICMNAVEFAKRWVDEAPTVDGVEIVQCGEGIWERVYPVSMPQER